VAVPHDIGLLTTCQPSTSNSVSFHTVGPEKHLKQDTRPCSGKLERSSVMDTSLLKGCTYPEATLTAIDIGDAGAAKPPT
jgi:hypothetical protein